MSLTYQEMVERARALITEVTTEWVSSREDPLIVDVREPKEHAAGVLENAVLLPLGDLQREIDRVAPDRSREIVLYCAVGGRSALAAHALQEMGYTAVASMAGGYASWRSEGRPWVLPDAPTTGSRYARHMTLPGVGAAGQQRLGDASVLVVGAGGLGSPATLYLAAAGIGRLAIVDDDVVELTNLQRQVLHDTPSIGAAKVDSAAATVARLNPDIVVEPHSVRLSSVNAVDLIEGHDVVVDGADNFPTRYLLNDAALHARVPVVHGSVFRFEGQISVFDPYRGPCYRCLFPEPPPPELAPNCAEAGVLGVLPGVIGAMQGVEAMKLILGIGEPLVGRLLTYDALTQDVTTLSIRRDSDCPACGDESAPPRLVDYDEACRPVA